MIYVWLAILLLNCVKPFWRWIQRYRANRWPTTTGEIRSTSLSQAKKTFFSPAYQSPAFVAELGYSYSAAGQAAAGSYRRNFGIEAEALDFLRDLKGKPVTVHFNSDRPLQSSLTEDSVAALLRLQPPRPPGDLLLYASANAMPDWIRPFLRPLMGLSAIGLICSLFVHLGSLTGHLEAPTSVFVLLHMGIFVVWFPAVLMTQRGISSSKGKDFWRVALRGAPEWMRYVVYGFFGYAMVNFLFFFQSPVSGKNSGTNPPDLAWRGFSGHWMAFYSTALALFYSAWKADQVTPRCTNRHALVPGALFCTRCGQSVSRN